VCLLRLLLLKLMGFAGWTGLSLLPYSDFAKSASLWSLAETQTIGSETGSLTIAFERLLESECHLHPSKLRLYSTCVRLFDYKRRFGLCSGRGRHQDSRGRKNVVRNWEYWTRRERRKRPECKRGGSRLGCARKIVQLEGDQQCLDLRAFRRQRSKLPEESARSEV